MGSAGEQEPALPATAFRPGDKVLGEDEGGKHMGVVSEHHGRHGHDDVRGVLIYWDEEEYVSSSLGHDCPPELLRLWPSRAHDMRLAEVARG